MNWESTDIFLNDTSITFVTELGYGLYINGVEVSDRVQVNSVRINDQLNNRNTMSFTLRGSTDIEVGMEVVFADEEAYRLFGGSVAYVQYQVITGTPLIEYRVECVDYNELADRRIVAEVYENKTAGFIVKDIVDNFMDGEGITYSDIEDGPVISKAVFNYNSVNAALNELSELTGLAWYIDYYKELHFFSRETNVSPISITDTSQNWRGLFVKKGKERYRNVQYIRGGKGTSNDRIEEFVGDGTRKTFTLSLPIAMVPSVKVNGDSKTVGIRGIEDGRDWYWNKDSNEVSQDDGSSALTDSDELEVTYRGFYPILLESSQDDSIFERQALEDSSGRYVAIDTDGKIESPEAAMEKASGLLRRFGTMPLSVSFETDEMGLRAGQLISVDIPEYNLSGNYQVENVTTSEIGGRFFRSRVTALSGESFGGWIEYFKKITSNNQDYNIRENEVLLKLTKVTEDIEVYDSFAFVYVGDYARTDVARTDFAEVPPDDI